MSIQPWRRGKCEAGLEGAASHLAACDRPGRWLVDGIVLCGTCTRAVLDRCPFCAPDERCANHLPPAVFPPAG